MPNWCQNVMYIKNHNPSLVKAIKEATCANTLCQNQRMMKVSQRRAGMNGA